MFRAVLVCPILLLFTGLSVNAQMNGKAPLNAGAINIADIEIKDILGFNIKKVKLFPTDRMTEGAFAFSYDEQCFYFIKTLDENKMQYSIVKCGADNKEMLAVDISTWVQDFAQRIVDSGLCKARHYCFRLSFQAYHRYTVLDIHYSGESHPDKGMNQLIVFGPDLKVVCKGEDIRSASFLASKKLLPNSDSLFLEDLKGEQLVSYKDSIPATIYKAKGNEVVFWDREKSKFYSAVTDRNALTVYDLFDEHLPVLKIAGLNKSSNPLLIDNNLLFIFQDDNIYYINIKTLKSAGYRISPASYNIYPNKSGFFYHYPFLKSQSDADYSHVYSFIPINDLK